MNIRDWHSVGYIKFGKEIHRMWQWRKTNWYITIPADDDAMTATILMGVQNGSLFQSEEMRTSR